MTSADLLERLDMKKSYLTDESPGSPQLSSSESEGDTNEKMKCDGTAETPPHSPKSSSPEHSIERNKEMKCDGTAATPPKSPIVSSKQSIGERQYEDADATHSTIYTTPKAMDYTLATEGMEGPATRRRKKLMKMGLKPSQPTPKPKRKRTPESIKKRNNEGD